MAKARKDVRSVEPLHFGAIMILDEDPRTRKAVSERLQRQFDDAHEIVEAADGDEGVILLRSLRQDSGAEVPVIAVNVTPQSEVGAPKRDQLIAKLREEVPEMTRIIAYTEKPSEQVRQEALAAGASTCVGVDDVEASVHGVFLEEALGALNTSVPIVAAVLNTMNVGISIQNPQMDVLWANARTWSVVDERDAARRKCWERYHKFYNRKCSCASCTAWCVLQSAIEEVAQGKPVSNGRLTDYHLLPIQGRIGRVEVNAAPLISRDGRKALAVIEATRFVTKEWEKNTEAHDRLNEVIAAARELGRDRKGASASVTLAVYYRPGEHQDLHLFDLAAEEGHTAPKLLRLAESPAEYREVLADGQPRFFAESAPDATRRHFLWPGQTPSMGIKILIDVVYADDKPEGLFTGDLRPYWEYVIEHFDAARETREKTFEQTLNSALEGFLARTANGVRDQASLDRALEGAVESVKKALAPFSMYVRLQDRSASHLVKRSGFGPYYDMAPENRELRYEGIGSGRVASRREGYWIEAAELEELRRFLDRPLSASEEAQLKRIAGYVTLPLVWMDRVLGTLCIQFEDDSLFSLAKRQFIEAITGALGSALGSLEWARQRAAVSRCSNDLDRTMFQRSERPEEEETRLLSQVTRMAFELTAAEVVAYYRCDAPSRKLTLVPGATQGTLPAEVALPEAVPPGVGVLSLAAADMRGYRVQDYRADDWRGVRSRLLAAFPWGAQNRFCHWVGSEIAEPVVGGHTVLGVLVAMSSIPGWLGPDDAAVVQEFAFKTGLCLEAKQLTRQLNWHSRVKMSLNDITAAMARISDLSILHRLFLLAITTDECLGFSRAILFLRDNGDEHTFIAAEAVGARSRMEAEARWAEANATPLAAKMDACGQPPRTRPGDVRELLPRLLLDLREHPIILGSFREGKMAVRRRGQEHLVRETRLRAAVCPEGNQDGEYVLVPLTTRGEMMGAVLADRAFLMATDISPDRLELLQSLASEFSRMIEAVNLRREEQEATIATELARGVSYSLGSRVGLLEARMSMLRRRLGQQHADAIAEMENDIEFFKRTAALSTSLLRVNQLSPEDLEVLDLNETISEAIRMFPERRIEFDRSPGGLTVRGAGPRIEDLVVELLLNARDFTDPDGGRIWVQTSARDYFTQIDIRDNGKGVHPDIRTSLFQPFKCYPHYRRGLGLAYAKAVAEAHGGSIDEIGGPAEGAHFVVRIPLAQGQMP